MIGKKNILTKIIQSMEQFFSDLDANVFLVRKDGMILWEKKKDVQSQAKGALTAGLWEASSALINAHFRERTEGVNFSEKVLQDLKVSIALNGQGVFALSTRLSGETYVIAVFFENILNPGKLKFLIEQKRLALEFSFENEPSSETLKPKDQTFNSQERAEFLFQQISDEEIDRLFGTAN
jgi:hypothetical protein